MSETKQINTGGPAFPSWVPTESGPIHEVEQELRPGMTLRDYFAAKAMPELMRQWDENDEAFSDVRDIAATAYVYADAMLKARG